VPAAKAPKKTVTSKPKASGLLLPWCEGATFASSITFPLEPVPASRPRVTRWGTYHAKPYKNWLDQAGKFLTDGLYVNKYVGEDPLLVVVESVITKARTSKLRIPKGDVDNYAKGPMDAITHAGLHWYDDKQVTALFSVKRFADPGEPAHTAVHIYTLPCD
jgi:Holliday junction resolvase RusA-like endonuclease